MYEPWGYRDENNYQGTEIIHENDLDKFFAGVEYKRDDNKIHFTNKDGDEAFYECDELTSVTINATTPPTLGDDAFYDTNNCPIYVPSGSVDTYKSASGWSSLASRIQPIA